MTIQVIKISLYAYDFQLSFYNSLFIIVYNFVLFTFLSLYFIHRNLIYLFFRYICMPNRRQKIPLNNRQIDLSTNQY